MSPSDPRPPADLEAAADLVKATAMTVAERVCQTLSAQSQAASKAFDRNTMFAAQLALHRQLGPFRLSFRTRLDLQIRESLNQRPDFKRPQAPTDWQSLSLVDDSEVEERMHSDRIAQKIAHACEAELREVASYMGQVMGFGTADESRNPLRPAVVGQATYSAVESVTTDPDERRVLWREFGVVMAQAMPACYSAIVVELQSRGVKPAGFLVKTTDRAAPSVTGLGIPNSGYRDDDASTSGRSSEFQSSTRTGIPGTDRQGRQTSSGFASSSAYAGGWGSGQGAAGGAPRSGDGPDSRMGMGSVNSQAGGGSEAQLMTLLRRLTQLANRPAELGPSSLTTGQGGLSGSGRSRFGADSGSIGAALGAAGGDGLQGSGSAGLMAVNLIRAHRDELMRASTGKLDHMVIDVVGSLFDQILSDSRVPPQMARQIARLQLPVLRVALVDPNFFSSRRHPVRRFVNRIASLACAFDDFDDGPGKVFVTRVRDLVQEIVDGDFDQVDLYAAKLTELESFIAQQAESSVQESGTLTVLESKESDLRTQQRYLVQLHGALTPVPMPEFLRNFLSQVWSQALIAAEREGGADSDAVKRYRLVGRDAVMSVQPKGSPAMRKRFLMQLPALMKDLNEGLKLIGWPDAAQKEFFAQLMPAHAESLKVPAMTELDYNMLSKQIEAVFNNAVPRHSDLVRSSPGLAISATSADIEQRFSEEEAKQVGLVSESAVDWSKPVDIDLSEEAAVSEPVPMNLGVDINLDLAPDEPPEPSHGASLMDHLRIGFAYQMLLKDQWQKVRLTYMSPGRSFFVFSHGRANQETISLTARMLSRMCQSERLRAVESTYLMERATSRARKQLAELTANSRQ
jgi:hypothetical protein